MYFTRYDSIFGTYCSKFGNRGISVLETRLLEDSFGWKAVPHQVREFSLPIVPLASSPMYYVYLQLCNPMDDLYLHGMIPWTNPMEDVFLLSHCLSALFVVDLKQFRAVGAGDSLRSVYMALSRDKDSLANLDQDLPNFAQHEISIYPLPQVRHIVRHPQFVLLNISSERQNWDKANPCLFMIQICLCSMAPRNGCGVKHGVLTKR